MMMMMKRPSIYCYDFYIPVGPRLQAGGQYPTAPYCCDGVDLLGDDVNLLGDGIDLLGNGVDLVGNGVQGLTGRVFQLWFGSGSGIGKNISGRFGYGSGTGICIIYRANRVLSGNEKLDRVLFGYFFNVTYLLYGMNGKRL